MIKNYISKDSKKNITVEAIQINWSNWSNICDFLQKDKIAFEGVYLDKETLTILPEKNTSDIIGVKIQLNSNGNYSNQIIAKQDDFLVKSQNGEFYIKSPKDFNSLFIENTENNLKALNLVSILNSIWENLEPVDGKKINSEIQILNINSFLEFERNNPKIGFKSDFFGNLSISILSLIATITDILIDIKIAAIVDEEGYIKGWTIYDNNNYIKE